MGIGKIIEINLCAAEEKDMWKTLEG